MCKISLKGKGFRDYSSDHSSDHSSLFVVQISKIYHDFYAFCAIVDDGLDSLMSGPFFSSSGASVRRFPVNVFTSSAASICASRMFCPRMRWRRCANRYCLHRYILCADGCCRRQACTPAQKLLLLYSLFLSASCYCCTACTPVRHPYKYRVPIPASPTHGPTAAPSLPP